MFVECCSWWAKIKPALYQSLVSTNLQKKWSVLGTRLSQQTKHLYNSGTTSAQRLRRWSNIVQMLYKCFVFDEMAPCGHHSGCSAIKCISAGVEVAPLRLGCGIMPRYGQDVNQHGAAESTPQWRRPQVYCESDVIIADISVTCQQIFLIAYV